MASIGPSVVVIARDEADRIEDCLRSVAWAPERLVIVDDRTVDETAEKARPLATEVISRPWSGFVGMKRFGIARARHSWILWVDADERVDPALAASIRSGLENPGGCVAFRMKRSNRYLGRPVRHGNWGRDSVVRLFRKDSADFEEVSVHEKLAVRGPIGILDGQLEHDPYRDLAHHGRKMLLWADLWSADAFLRGKRARVLDLCSRPPLRFLKGYILRAGFLDGRTGFLLAWMDAVHAGMKYASLMARQRSPREGGKR